jgi:hypothetical protein
MPTGRLTMRRIRDVLRLRFAQGLSDRAIAASLGLGKGSVGAYLRRAREAGLGWPLPDGLDDDSLELLLFPASPTVPDPDRPAPDWAAMDTELRKPGVTRMLLWQEYRAEYPCGFGYTWFCTHFDAWKGRVRPSMRQTHVGGEKVFVDFAGDTIDIIDPGTGEVRTAKLFVAAMGASSYTYAEAVASEGLEDWIGAQRRDPSPAGRVEHADHARLRREPRGSLCNAGPPEPAAATRRALCLRPLETGSCRAGLSCRSGRVLVFGAVRPDPARGRSPPHPRHRGDLPSRQARGQPRPRSRVAPEVRFPRNAAMSRCPTTCRLRTAAMRNGPRRACWSAPRSWDHRSPRSAGSSWRTARVRNRASAPAWACCRWPRALSRNALMLPAAVA